MASSKSQDVVLAAEFENKVHVWDLESRKFTKTITARFDFGGKRLALSNDGQTMYCAAYQRHGVSAYRVSDGALIWNRRDLKKCQYLGSLADDRGLWCAFDHGPLRCLDRETGLTTNKIRGARRMWESPYEPLIFLIYSNRGELLNRSSGRVINIPLLTFGLLDATFTPGFITLSDVGGPTRCLCTNTGFEVWRRIETGAHSLQLGYSEADQNVLSIWWQYKSGGDHRLVAYDPKTGGEKMNATLKGAWEFTFCKAGHLLVCSNGAVVNTNTGNTEFCFTLPPYGP